MCLIFWNQALFTTWKLGLAEKQRVRPFSLGMYPGTAPVRFTRASGWQRFPACLGLGRREKTGNSLAPGLLPQNCFVFVCRNGWEESVKLVRPHERERNPGGSVLPENGVWTAASVGPERSTPPPRCFCVRAPWETLCIS